MVLWGSLNGCSGCASRRWEPVLACFCSQYPICGKGKSGGTASGQKAPDVQCFPDDSLSTRSAVFLPLSLYSRRKVKSAGTG